MTIYEQDLYWMNRAYALAEQAAQKGEVPVGAVVVKDDKLVGQGYNQMISSNDPTAHAEIGAIRDAASKLNNYRLIETTLYVTLEPCIMCAGAMIHARILRLVYGATDPKTGAINSQYGIGSDGKLNHELLSTGGILEEKCSHLLKTFFAEKRENRKSKPLF